MEELPLDVVEAIRQGRKVEAIKLLREHRGIALKEAKDAVEAFMGDHAETRAPPTVTRSRGMLGPIVFIALLGAMAYGLLQLLAS